MKSFPLKFTAAQSSKNNGRAQVLGVFAALDNKRIDYLEGEMGRDEGGAINELIHLDYWMDQRNNKKCRVYVTEEIHLNIQ